MRVCFALILTCWMMSAQEPPAAPVDSSAPVTVAPAAAAPAIAVQVVPMDVAPLAPPDLETPYASPRDAARHRFQATLGELQSGRSVKAGLQGFAEAFALDRTYAAAAFNLGVIAAIAGKWDDALSAFEEAERLDAGLRKEAAPQIERLSRIRSLEATPEGKRRRAYDEALFPLLQELGNLNAGEAMTGLAEIGKIDPKRWEAPALLAGLSGNGRGYDVAAKFLEIAISGASQPAAKERLQKALEAAQRELRYAAARATADAAADRGEYDKAADLYEKTWAVMPARASNGMEAASAWLLHDDTARAAALLARLREAGDSEYAGSAAAMLKELEPIEPEAKTSSPDARDFFRDAGPADPVFIADLLPPIDQSQMELLARPLPKLISDPEPVVLLSALSANPIDGAPATALPALPPLRIVGESPWRELSQLRADQGPADPAAPVLARGSIIVDAAATDLRLNGVPVNAPAPVELSVQPGLYRVEWGAVRRELNLKPGARLRVR